MSGIAIYMEGGGNTVARKQQLRQGMDFFLSPLKKVASAKGWTLNIVPCGPRNEAFKRFCDEWKTGDASIIALLVDAEAAVNGAPRVHLKKKDNWDLSFAKDELVHLMVQTMEAWIVADADALANYYGQGFKKNALPASTNLDSVAKSEVAAALDKATRDTKTKGKYDKLQHAKDLLKLIDPAKVQKRCPSCKRMFADLTQAIQGA
jgi:hypothetical protein